MESFDTYVGGGDDVANTRPFDSDGYMGFDPRLPSQRFDSFRMPEESDVEEHYTQGHSKDMGELDEEHEYTARKEGTSSNGGFDEVGSEVPPPYNSSFDDVLGDGQSPSMSSTFGQSFESRLQPDFAPTDEFSPSVDSNGKGFGHGEGFPHSEDFGYGFPPSGSSSGFHNGGAVLPPLDEMENEEGFVLREWKRKNAIHLEEKARTEREKLSQIIDAADSFKDGFYEKRKMHCETTKKNNREKEKVFLENLENFHATADKHYWKAVAELVPHELPSKEVKSRGKKDKKKPAVVINHGPKPGKATDLTRMRQVLVKLKHNPPAHMKAPPPAPPAAAGTEGADAKTSAPVSDTASAPAPAPLQKQGSIPTAVSVA
eukprot:c5015_g1_i1 orf=183-1301(+)